MRKLSGQYGGSVAAGTSPFTSSPSARAGPRCRGGKRSSPLSSSALRSTSGPGRFCVDAAVLPRPHVSQYLLVLLDRQRQRLGGLIRLPQRGLELRRCPRGPLIRRRRGPRLSSLTRLSSLRQVNDRACLAICRRHRLFLRPVRSRSNNRHGLTRRACANRPSISRDSSFTAPSTWAT